MFTSVPTPTTHHRRAVSAAVVAIVMILSGCQAVSQGYSSSHTMDDSLDNYSLSNLTYGDPQTLDLGPTAGLQFGCFDSCTVASVTLNQISGPTDAQLVRCADETCNAWQALTPLTTYNPSGGGIVRIEDGDYVKVGDGCLDADLVRVRARTATMGGTDFFETSMTHVCGIPD